MNYAFVFLIALSFGCQSDCKKLCAKQITCSAPGSTPSASLPDAKQRELCATMCETMNESPEKKASMGAVLACDRGADCATFRACVSKAAAAPTAQ